MTHGESIRELLAGGPMSREALIARMEARCVAPVVTNTVLIGMEQRRVIAVRGELIVLIEPALPAESVPGRVFDCTVKGEPEIYGRHGHEKPSVPADDEGPCPDGQHRWVGKQMGGSPDMAESYEWVEYCDICGVENTED
jgi:hypothetical protein